MSRIRALALLLIAAQLQGCASAWTSVPAARGPLGRQLPRTMRLHLQGDSALVLDGAVLRSDSIVGVRPGARRDTVAVALAEVKKLELRRGEGQGTIGHSTRGSVGLRVLAAALAVGSIILFERFVGPVQK